MVVPELTLNQEPRALQLFERLGGNLFGPLASANKQRYWTILCSLHQKRFGPDAPLPPSKGYTYREIVADIEYELSHQDDWIQEAEDSGEANDTSASMAAQVMIRLVNAGWLKVDRRALSRTVIMRPVVSHFLTQLINFAERGPVFVSGKINVIETSLREVAQGDKLGDVLGEVSQQARDLLEHIRNTGNIIRELMDTLDTQLTTAQYVRSFFENYIERVFIGDYREMRTKEHPLARRQKILQIVDAIDEATDIRAKLVAWYQQNRTSGDASRAEQLFEKDMQRLRDLGRIDEYIARLDEEIRRANRKAFVYLDHRLRSVNFLDAKIQHAIQAILSSPSPAVDPFGAGEMVSPDRLAEPRKVTTKHKSTALRSVSMSPRDLALSKVLQRARAARMMNSHKLSEFVQTTLEAAAPKVTLDSTSLELTSVPSIRAYQALSSVAMAMASKRRPIRLMANVMARGFSLTPIGGADEPHSLLTGRPFRLTTKQRRKGTA
jgi:hypothetical protein